MGIKRAKTKELRAVNAAELGVEAAPTVALEQIAAPKKQKSTQILAGLGERSCGSAGREAENGGAGAMSILLVLEESGGKIKRASWEALAAALKLGPAQDVTAVVIGAQTEALAAEAATKGIGKVVRVEHPLLAHYTADGFSLALHQLIQNQNGTKCVVFPHTYQVRDYAPALACTIRPGADWRRDGHRRRADLHAATDAGAAERKLPAQRQRAVLCLGAGGCVSGGCICDAGRRGTGAD